MSDTGTIQPEWVIGLMSGTSMDGIDAALVRTDGKAVQAFGPFVFTPYSAADRQLLLSALGGRQNVDKAAEIVTTRHADAVRAICQEAEKEGIAPALIGFHGQTIDHQPDLGETWQIGDGVALARQTGLPVVWDFRSEDMRQGGQGAPLVPVYHRALGAGYGQAQIFLNIGGVSNITFIDGDGQMIAFDTGPGNALMDDHMMRHAGQDIDEGGKVARQGQVMQQALDAMMDHPWFGQKPPKSLDRNSFDVSRYLGNHLEDNMATLAAFTVEAIAAAFDWLPAQPARCVVCGGGRLNGFLMALLAERLPCKVVSAEEIGLRGDAIEAEAFAVLAQCVRHGLPTSFPGTTGCRTPVSGGVLSFPSIS